MLSLDQLLASCAHETQVSQHLATKMARRMAVVRQEAATAEDKSLGASLPGDSIGGEHS